MSSPTRTLISPTIKNVQYKSISEEQDGSSSSDFPAVSQRPPSSQEYRVYPWRWFMLFTLCMLNVSNGMMWLTFAPIPNFTASYYHVSVSNVDWFSMSFFAVSLIVGIISIFILNRFGLRVVVYAGAAFNMIGSILRVVSTIEPIICSPLEQSGFVVAMLGQVLTACAQPCLLYSPTTLASIWFGPKERAVATGLSSLANPIGLAVVQVASPYIVTSVSKLPMLLLIYAIPAIATFLLALVAFWYKVPPIPPTSSSNRDNVLSFFQGLKKIVFIPSFLLLLVVWGCAAGMFNALLTVLPQILCPYGYSDKDSGLWGSLMIFCGMLGAVIGGLILDYSKLFKELTVLFYALAIVCLVWFYEVFSSTGQAINIAFSLCCFGFFALNLIPAFMELGVEVTYPVSEVTSSGLLWSSAQIVGILLVLIGQQLQYTLSDELLAINQCSGTQVLNDTSVPKCFRPSHNESIPSAITTATEVYNSSNTVLLCLSVGAINFVLLVVCVRPKYQRLEAEKRNLLQSATKI